MTRLGADVTVAAYAPEGLAVYLGYVDGNYRSYAALKARFPHAVVVGIAVNPATDDGVVFDGPPDNATWPQVVEWVVMRRRAGVDPTVYTDASDWATAVQAFNAAGVAVPHWWIAQWDEIPSIPDGAIGKQYASNAHYDSDIFVDTWPGVDAPAPPPSKPPAPPPVHTPPAPPADPYADFLEDDMILVNVTGVPAGSTGGIYLLSGELYSHVPTEGDASALTGAGVKQCNITWQMHQQIIADAAKLQGSLSGVLNMSGQLTAS